MYGTFQALSKNYPCYSQNYYYFIIFMCVCSVCTNLLVEDRGQGLWVSSSIYFSLASFFETGSHNWTWSWLIWLDLFGSEAQSIYLLLPYTNTVVTYTSHYHTRLTWVLGYLNSGPYSCMQVIYSLSYVLHLQCNYFKILRSFFQSLNHISMILGQCVWFLISTGTNLLILWEIISLWSIKLSLGN